MKSEAKERWMQLCELAADEQNPAKLLALITEINDLLEKKRSKINGATGRGKPPRPTGSIRGLNKALCVTE
jgi:hypothetical protein